MPLGGGRGLSGRLDSRELPHNAAMGAITSQRSGLGMQGNDEEQRRRRQATAVEQLRTGSVGPSPLGGRSSMPELHVLPPPISTQPPGAAYAFPLNPHQSYDEEWGTMGVGGGHDSDSDVFLTPHASGIHPDPAFGHGASPKSSPQEQAPGTAAMTTATDHSQLPLKSPANTQFAAHPPLQPHRPPQDPARTRLELSSSASAPAGPPTGPPSTPERPHPSTSDKFYSPQHQQPPQLQQRSPASLLSRASARIRVALEASEATIKAGPADPPPRQPGLPPSSGHRRTSSQQVHATVSETAGCSQGFVERLRHCTQAMYRIMHRMCIGCLTCKTQKDFGVTSSSPELRHCLSLLFNGHTSYSSCSGCITVATAAMYMSHG